MLCWIRSAEKGSCISPGRRQMTTLASRSSSITRRGPSYRRGSQSFARCPYLPTTQQRHSGLSIETIKANMDYELEIPIILRYESSSGGFQSKMIPLAANIPRDLGDVHLPLRIHSIMQDPDLVLHISSKFASWDQLMVQNIAKTAPVPVLQ